MRFKIGDRVRRVSGTYEGMKIGDEDVVKEIRPGGVTLEKYGPGHSLASLDLVESEKQSSSKENKPMSIVSKIKELALDADTKLLKKYNIIDDTRELTEEGKEVLLNHLFEQNKAGIVAKLKEVDTDEKKAKKEAK